MFVTNWISTTKIQKISEITNFFRHYFLSRTEVSMEMAAGILITCKKAELRVRKSSLLLICDFGKSEDGFYLNAPASAS